MTLLIKASFLVLLGPLSFLAMNAESIFSTQEKVLCGPLNSAFINSLKHSDRRGVLLKLKGLKCNVEVLKTTSFDFNARDLVDNKWKFPTDMHFFTVAIIDKNEKIIFHVENENDTLLIKQPQFYAGWKPSNLLDNVSTLHELANMLKNYSASGKSFHIRTVLLDEKSYTLDDLSIEIFNSHDGWVFFFSEKLEKNFLTIRYRLKDAPPSIILETFTFK